MEILCRRRKNNPVFVGDAGVGKTALAEGLAIRLLEADVPSILEGAEIFSLDTAALLAGTRFRGDFEERFKAVLAALKSRRLPILFIDEIHATIGAGATTGGTMDLATLIKPVLTAGELRVVGSTTFEEFKQIEKDRALARRLQKVVVEEPTVEETIKILQGLRSPLRGAPPGRVRRTRPSRSATKLAKRFLRDYRLPDSAIDILDEAGAMLRLQAPSGAGDRGRGGAAAPGDAGRDRARGRADGAHPRQAGHLLREGAAADARGIAAARGVRPGRGRADRYRRHQAVARGAGAARPTGRVLPVHRADRGRARPSWRGNWRCTWATSSCATT